MSLEQMNGAYDIPGAAAWLGMTVDGVLRAIRSGNLPAYSYPDAPKRKVLRAEDLVAYRDELSPVERKAAP